MALDMLMDARTILPSRGGLPVGVERDDFGAFLPGPAAWCASGGSFLPLAVETAVFALVAVLRRHLRQRFETRTKASRPAVHRRHRPVCPGGSHLITGPPFPLCSTVTVTFGAFLQLLGVEPICQWPARPCRALSPSRSICSRTVSCPLT